ncbi:UNVERIFIED_CONTAM: hypothetical protein Cloal_3680 [Acetivibrio alkalicellulosi]
MKLLLKLKELCLKEDAQNIVEYGLIVGLASVMGVLAVTIFRGEITALIIKVADAISAGSSRIDEMIDALGNIDDLID